MVEILMGIVVEISMGRVVTRVVRRMAESIVGNDIWKMAMMQMRT